MAKAVEKRRNNKNDKGGSSDNKQKNDTNNSDRNEEREPDHSYWRIISRHPLFWGLTLLGFPYLCYLLFRYVVLQKPDWIPTIFVPVLEPTIPVRPYVSMSSPRQVLVVGSMSSGTSQVAHDMSSMFPGFELGHEDSDTLWKFVRDGTVSWFHGIRFFPPPPLAHSPEEKEGIPKTNLPWTMNQTAVSLCGVAYSFYTAKSNYGFGPTLFGTPNYTCSFLNPNFKQCWLKECVRIISREYGCAWDQSCQTPFERSLIQTRDPWNIVTSLVTKYCKDDLTNTVKPPATLVRFFMALLGPKFLTADEEVRYGKSVPYVSCESLMVHYVVTYYNLLLDAYLQPRRGVDTVQDETRIMIHGIFPIEYSTVCDVARLAGLDSRATTVFEPNYDTVQRVCGGVSNSQHNQKQPGNFARTQNLINRDRLNRVDVMESIMNHKDVKNNSLFDLLDRKMRHLYSRMEYYDYPVIAGPSETGNFQHDEF